MTGRKEQGITVGDFCRSDELASDLEILQGDRGMENVIYSPRIQKLGLALAGFGAQIHPDRIQVIGASEINYLGILDFRAAEAAIDGLRKFPICCILLTRGLVPPPSLLTVAQEVGIPLLRTRLMSSVAISRTTRFLESRLAPRTTIHGVLVDVFGLGVLLLGPSGIGKSECALELVLKGHRLIADDYVDIRRIGPDRLVGAGGKHLEYHMELRGLGIIDIKELFGISATARSQKLDIAVRLERWRDDKQYDRLGLEPSTVDFLGLPVPLIEMPVAPGRNVSTLVEVAARIHLLRQRGYSPSSRILETWIPDAEGRRTSPA